MGEYVMVGSSRNNYREKYLNRKKGPRENPEGRFFVRYE